MRKKQIVHRLATFSVLDFNSCKMSVSDPKGKKKQKKNFLGFVKEMFYSDIQKAWCLNSTLISTDTYNNFDLLVCVLSNDACWIIDYNTTVQVRVFKYLLKVF